MPNQNVELGVELDDKKARAEIKSLAGSFKKAFAVVGAGFAGLKIARTISSTTKELFDLNNELQATRNALKAVGKDSREIENDIGFLRDTSVELGADFNQLSKTYARLEIGGKRLGLTTQENRDVMVALSEAMVVTHATAQDTFLIFNAIEQIMAKGKVQSEEIVRQFAQRIPGGLQIAAAAVGATTKEFSELLRLGQVDPREFFQGLDDALVDFFGAALPAALDTSQTRLKILQAEFTILKQDLGSELEPAFKETFKALSSALRIVQRDLDTADLGQAIRDSLAEIAESAGEFIQNFERNKKIAKYGLLGLMVFGVAGPTGVVSRLKTLGIIGGLITLGDAAVNAFNATPAEKLKGAIGAIEREIVQLQAEVILLDKMGAFSPGQGMAQQANLAEKRIAAAKLELIDMRTELAGMVEEAESNEFADIFFNLAEGIREGKKEIESLGTAMVTVTNEAGPLRRAFVAVFDEGSEAVDDFNSAIDDWEDKTVDAFLNVAKEGSAAFGDLAESILEDLARIAIQRKIVGPAFDSLFATESTTTSTPVANANGNAFSGGNVVPFAKGGVVDSPIGFPMKGGKNGLMGEAGPEAIMPLKRDSSGRLGVAASGGGQGGGVTVNIINQTPDSEVETTTSADGKFVEVMIKKTIKDGISGGEFDKVLGSSFGMSRRGS